MNNTAVFVKLGTIRDHSNADRLKLTTIFGNQVVVGLDAKEGDIGVFFETNLQLSEEFATKNDLVRRKDSAGNKAGGMFDANRKVRCQKLRGERSEGFYVPLSYFSYIGDISISKTGAIQIAGCKYQLGDEFNKLCNDKYDICEKFIVRTRQSSTNKPKKKKKFKYDSVMFHEHIDTPQLFRNLKNFEIHDTIIITAKLHGTSHRYGHVLIEQPLPWYKNLLETLFKRELFKRTKKWGYLSGTRRVVLQPEGTQQSYHDPKLREIAIKPFINNLRKGETVFFEIVGFEPNGAFIMPPTDTTKMKDKEFTARYGTNMMFTYGCKSGECDVYVYRISVTNEDGVSYDYSWHDVKARCKELGVKHVPQIFIGSIYEYILENHASDEFSSYEPERIVQVFCDDIDEYVSRPDLIDSTHILEGIVIRKDTGLNFDAYKHKSFEFKVLEDILSMDNVENQEDNQGIENEGT